MGDVLDRCIRVAAEDGVLIPWMDERAMRAMDFLDVSKTPRHREWLGVKNSLLRDFTCDENHSLAVIKLHFEAGKVKYLPGVCACRLAFA